MMTTYEILSLILVIVAIPMSFGIEFIFRRVKARMIRIAPKVKNELEETTQIRLTDDGEMIRMVKIGGKWKRFEDE